MRLHIFNPEHDIALAHGSPYFTAPKAGRWLRRDCGFLPLLWADESDAVLVDDVGLAREAASYTFNGITGGVEAVAKGRLVARSELAHLPITDVCPWGWDAALAHELRHAGVGEKALLSAEHLNAIRQLSHRRTAARLLPETVQVDSGKLIGNALIVTSMEELAKALLKQGGAMLKAPWSSSGRGLRRVGSKLDETQRGWVQRVLQQQGALMMEPIYNKVVDFGMEFFFAGQEVAYRGLSIFSTAKGAYTGNALVTEQEKVAMLAHYVDEGLLTCVREAVGNRLQTILSDQYQGPLGVDMMVVDTDSGVRLHPMVEINLRRTMGHVAIDLAERLAPFRGRMHIDYSEGRYRLHVEKENRNNQET